jgi:hypothetical protein
MRSQEAPATAEVEMSETHGTTPGTHDTTRDTSRDQDDVQRMGARTVLEERTYASEVRPAGITRTVSAGERRDRVRWGPIWAGLVVALGTFLLLQLALVALGAFGDDVDRTGLPEGALLSGLAALIAFFVGGLVTGASTMWRDGDDGVFHGVVLWALAVVSLLLLSVLGSGLALGAASDLTEDLGIGTEEVEQDVEDIDADEASERAESAAGGSLIGLALTLAASVAGAVVGSKMWPPKNRRAGAGTAELTDDRRTVGSDR